MQNKKCDKSKRNEVENCILDCIALFFFPGAATAAALPPWLLNKILHIIFSFRCRSINSTTGKCSLISSFMHSMQFGHLMCSFLVQQRHTHVNYNLKLIQKQKHCFHSSRTWSPCLDIKRRKNSSDFPSCSMSGEWMMINLNRLRHDFNSKRLITLSLFRHDCYCNANEWRQ